VAREANFIDFIKQSLSHSIWRRPHQPFDHISPWLS
jgi:hypothetical protein